MNAMTTGRAFETLIEGNRRFAGGKSVHPRGDRERRAEVVRGQRPYAAIVACSDSRVAPELIFDQGLGDLFVVRSAGNLIDALGLSSIEYAVGHLGVPLVVVVGHSSCGAVKAALEEGASADRPFPIVSALGPAIERARVLGGTLEENTARENARLAAARLRGAEPILTAGIERGSLRIMSAFYDLETGVVSFFD
jgi:carbonic anhydrase